MEAYNEGEPKVESTPSFRVPSPSPTALGATAGELARASIEVMMGLSPAPIRPKRRRRREHARSPTPSTHDLFQDVL
jgi:hypothetical protein